MVDAEHRVRVEHLGDHAVELLGAGQIVPEWLFDDHAPAGVAVRFGQTAVGELLRHEREVTGRNRHVEGMVAACATVLVEFGHRVAQALERIGILEGAMHETYALCKLVKVTSLKCVRQCCCTFSLTN